MRSTPARRHRLDEEAARRRSPRARRGRRRARRRRGRPRCTPPISVLWSDRGVEQLDRDRARPARRAPGAPRPGRRRPAAAASRCPSAAEQRLGLRPRRATARHGHGAADGRRAVAAAGGPGRGRRVDAGPRPRRRAPSGRPSAGMPSSSSACRCGRHLGRPVPPTPTTSGTGGAAASHGGGEVERVGLVQGVRGDEVHRRVGGDGAQHAGELRAGPAGVHRVAPGRSAAAAARPSAACVAAVELRDGDAAPAQVVEQQQPGPACAVTHPDAGTARGGQPDQRQRA